MNIVFFGSSKYVTPIIEFLSKNYSLQLVVTTEQSLTLPVPAYCIAHNIPYISVSSFSPDTIRQLADQIQNSKSEVAILASFGIIVGQDILDLFPKGIVNIHPSMLPEYRGPTPGVTAILDGKTTTGVSIMLLDSKMDHGPILAQEKIAITPDDTADSLYRRSFEKGAQMLATTLPSYVEGTLSPVPQDDSKATYTKPLTRESGKIDLIQDSRIMNHESMDRRIRAYYPWPGVWTTVMINDKGLRIKILPGEKVQPEGKKPMSYKDFMNGYTEGKELLEKLGLL